MRAPQLGLRSRFLRDAATLQGAALVTQSSQLLSSVAIAYLLGSHGQGLFVSAVSLQGLLFFLVNLGVTQTVVSQVAAAAARGHDQRVAAWLALLSKTVLVLSLATLVAGYFVLPAVAGLLYGDPRLGVWAWWLCSVPLLELPKLVALASFQGTRRMGFLARLENGQELVRIFLVVLGALVHQSAQGAILGLIASSALGAVLAFALYARARRDGRQPLPAWREIFLCMRDVPLREGLRQGLRIAVIKNGSSLFCVVLPRLIIGAVAGVQWVAYFHIAQRFLMVPFLMFTGVGRTLLPALGELAGQRDSARLGRLFARVTLITGCLISAGVLGTLAVIPRLVRLFFPEDYVDPVFTYAWILALGYVPLAFAVGLEAFFIVANQMRAWLGLVAVGALICVPLNVWMILAIPITGTAWGVSLNQSWVLAHLAYLVWFLTRSRRAGAVWGAGSEVGAAPGRPLAGA